MAKLMKDEFLSYSARCVANNQADQSIRCEAVDQTMLVLPYGARLPESLDARIARIVKSAYGDPVGEDGEETLEDVNDFEVDDDLFPASQYEEDDYTPMPYGMVSPPPAPAPEPSSPPLTASAVGEAEPEAE